MEQALKEKSVPVRTAAERCMVHLLQLYSGMGICEAVCESLKDADKKSITDYCQRQVTPQLPLCSRFLSRFLLETFGADAKRSWGVPGRQGLRRERAQRRRRRRRRGVESWMQPASRTPQMVWCARGNRE